MVNVPQFQPDAEAPVKIHPADPAQNVNFPPDHCIESVFATLLRRMSAMMSITFDELLA